MVVDNAIEKGKIYQKSADRYKNKFRDLIGQIPDNEIQKQMKLNGISEASMKDELLANSGRFQNFALGVAKSLITGRVACTAYAAIVAHVAESLGVDYKAYTGYCLQKESPKYARNKSDWDKSGAYQLVPTHVFVMIGDKYYEYFNGNTEGVDHLDAVEI